MRWELRVALRHLQSLSLYVPCESLKEQGFNLSEKPGMSLALSTSIKELLGITMSCIGITTSVNTDLLLQEWFLLLWATTSEKIWTSGLHQQRRVEGNLKPRRLWQIVTGAATRRRSQALVIRSCWCQTGVYYSSIKQLVPYSERQNSSSHKFLAAWGLDKYTCLVPLGMQHK